MNTVHTVTTVNTVFNSQYDHDSQDGHGVMMVNTVNRELNSEIFHVSSIEDNTYVEA